MDSKAHQPAAAVFLSSDRLASLSDTMFGVAMTLVATTLLPSIQAHTGSILALLPAIRGELFTVVLSFMISARYWVSQQQRLAMTDVVTPFQTALHLLFLFLIVLVPISTSLDGLTGSGARRDSVIIYGTHLTLLALVNVLLWIKIHRAASARLQMTQSSLALGLLMVALVVGAIRPRLAVYAWFTVLATPQLARFLTPQLQPT
jgi:uncharacterized membrane protein